MTKLFALYNHPADPAHFNDYYFHTHVPLAWQIPGLRRYEVSEGPVQTLEGPSPYHLIATLTFDSMADFQAGLASAAGQAAAGDLKNFAGAGVTILVSDTREVRPESGQA